MEPRRLAYIDALRGWAILLVVLCHASQGQTGVGALSGVLRRPAMRLPFVLHELTTTAVYGVQLFFVVSALALTLSWYARASAGPISIRDYALRRFFRIAPLFYVAIVFYLFLFGWGPRHYAPHGITGLDVALTAAFLHGWHWNSMNSVVPADWSMGCIAMFYLVLPVLMIIARRRWMLLALTLAGVVGTQLLDGYVRAHSANSGPLGSFGFPANATVFLFGVWAALLARDEIVARSTAVNARIGNACSLALFIILVFVLPFGHLPFWLFIHRIQFAAVAMLLCVSLHFYPVGLLVNPVTVRIGRVSYSIFVVHLSMAAPLLHLSQLAVARFAGPQSDDILLLLIYFPMLFGAAFAVANVTYALIEQPFIRLGARVIASLDGQAVAPSMPHSP